MVKVFVMNKKYNKNEIQIVLNNLNEMHIAMECYMENNELRFQKLINQNKKCEAEIVRLQKRIIELEDLLLVERMSSYSKNEISKQERKFQVQELRNKLDEIILMLQ